MKYYAALRGRWQRGLGTVAFSESRELLLQSLSAALGYATMTAGVVVVAAYAGLITFEHFASDSWLRSAGLVAFCAIRTRS